MVDPWCEAVELIKDNAPEGDPGVDGGLERAHW